MISKKVVFLFFILCLSVFSFEYFEATIKIFDKNEKPVPGASIKIGDLEILSNEEGIIETELPPTTYEVSIFKDGYYTRSSQIKISESNNNEFKFNIESKYLPIDLKIIDSLTGNPLAASIKIHNDITQEDFYVNTDNTGHISTKLEKKNLYTLEINENNFENFTYKIDANNLKSSSFLFKLERMKKEVNFSFNSPKGEATLKISDNNTFYKKFSFENNNKSIILPYGNYTIEVSSERYQQSSLSFEITNDTNEIIFNLTENFGNFNFRSYYTDYESFYSNEPPLIGEYAINSKIKIFKNSELINSFSTNEDMKTFELDYGSYNFEISNPYAEKFEVKKLELSKKNENLFFFLKKLYSTVEGTVKSGNYYLGDIEVIFEDNDGSSFSVKSGIDGSFFIQIPPKNYSVSIKEKGFRLKNSISLENLKSNELSSIEVELEEIPSLVKGRITTLRGKPVKDAKITMRVEKEERVFYSNDNGEYEGLTKSGLVFIKIEKPGMKSKGTVKKISRYSTLAGIDFKLEEIYSSISGHITDGIAPLPGIKIEVIDFESNVISETISTEEGAFIIDDLLILQKYFIRVDDPDYKEYTSNSVFLNRQKVSDFNIILDKKFISVVFEVKNQQNEPMADIPILLNGVEYISDINGIIHIDVQEGVPSIIIDIKNYGVSDIFELEDNLNGIYRKEIIINKDSDSKITDTEIQEIKEEPQLID